MTEQSIPHDLEYAVRQSMLDDMKARHAKEEDLVSRIKQINEAYNKEIYEFLGPKSKEYETFYEKRREAAESMKPQLTATTEGLKVESEFRKKRLAEIDQFIRNLEINVNDLRTIRKKYREEFKVAIKKYEELPNSKGEGQ